MRRLNLSIVVAFLLVQAANAEEVVHFNSGFEGWQVNKGDHSGEWIIQKKSSFANPVEVPTSPDDWFAVLSPEEGVSSYFNSVMSKRVTVSSGEVLILNCWMSDNRDSSYKSLRVAKMLPDEGIIDILATIKPHQLWKDRWTTITVDLEVEESSEVITVMLEASQEQLSHLIAIDSIEIRSSFYTDKPTERPTNWPTHEPLTKRSTNWPTEWPTDWPTGWPTGEPLTKRPTDEPLTKRPTDDPLTKRPTDWPTVWPTGQPWTKEPTDEPLTKRPTGKPTDWPTDWPTGQPWTKEPTDEPLTKRPTGRPTDWPTGMPTDWPTGRPTDWPTGWPTGEPRTNEPTDEPLTKRPTGWPTDWPTGEPLTKRPTDWPTDWPTGWITHTLPTRPTTESYITDSTDFSPQTGDSTGLNPTSAAATKTFAEYIDFTSGLSKWDVSESETGYWKIEKQRSLKKYKVPKSRSGKVLRTYSEDDLELNVTAILSRDISKLLDAKLTINYWCAWLSGEGLELRVTKTLPDGSTELLTAITPNGVTRKWKETTIDLQLHKARAEKLNIEAQMLYATEIVALDSIVLKGTALEDS